MTLADQLLRKPRLFEALTRIRNTGSLLRPAGVGVGRLLMERLMAAPRRITVGAGVAPLVAGISANGVLMQIGRHPEPLFAPATHDPLSASANAPPPGTTVETVAPQASPAPASATSTASAAAPAAAGQSRATQASAPDTTSSIGPATQENHHPSSAPTAPEGLDRGERRPAARAPDPIGALLRGKPVDDIASGARRPDRALEARICGQADGAEDVATRRALRHFVRAHGLAPTTEISSELVKQLTAAAGPGG